MADDPDYSNYVKCMEEIKRRQKVIDEMLQGTKTTSFRYTNVEFVSLQFRKVFELIILASIASHQHFFNGLVRKLSKEWQISKIIAIVSKKNPKFYPEPIDRIQSSKPGHKDEWTAVTSGFLTLDDLIIAHGKIGNLMHANNPYNEESMLEEIETSFSTWRERLVRLLNNHLIRFPDDETILYVGMQSIETGSVHISLFKKMSEATSEK